MCVHVCVRVMGVYVCVHVSVHVCVHVCVRVKGVYVCVCMCMGVHVCGCAYVWVCMCVGVHVSVLKMAVLCPNLLISKESAKIP